MKKQDPNRFSHDRWAKLLADTFAALDRLAALKGGEYSGDDDRLANFRRNAYNLDLNKETVWAVYAAKHWDALMQFIQDKQLGKERVRLEGIEGRIDDLLVYLLLFKAMVQEDAPPYLEVSEEQLKDRIVGGTLRAGRSTLDRNQ